MTPIQFYLVATASLLTWTVTIEALGFGIRWWANRRYNRLHKDQQGGMDLENASYDNFQGGIEIDPGILASILGKPPYQSRVTTSGENNHGPGQYL